MTRVLLVGERSHPAYAMVLSLVERADEQYEVTVLLDHPLTDAPPGFPVVVIAADGTVSDAVAAMQAGVASYITLADLTAERLEAALQHALRDGSLVVQYKEAVAARIESEAHLRLLTEYTRDVILSVNRDRVIEYVSPSAQSILGYHPHDMVGQPVTVWLDRVHPNDRPYFVDGMVQCFESGDIRLPPALRWQQADGRYIWLEAYPNVLRDRDGTVNTIVYACRDITERKDAEQALRESEDRFVQATRASRVGVWEWNLVTNAMFIAPALKTMLGYRPEEIADHLDDWGRLVHPDDAEAMFRATDDHIAGRTPYFEFEHRMIHKDGTIHWILARGQVLRDETGKAYRMVGTDTDITDNRRLRHDLQRRDAIMAAINFAAERFLKMPDWEMSIQHILRLLRAATEVSRVYVFENSQDAVGDVQMNQRYEWAATGISPQIDNPELQSRSYNRAGFARWQRMLQAGKPVYGLVRDFPANEQVILRSQSVISVAVIPIFVYGKWWGYIGFDVCDREHVWSDSELAALQTAASVFGAAIERKQIDHTLKEHHERFVTVLDSLDAGVYVADMVTFDVLFVNRHMHSLYGDVVGLRCWQAFGCAVDGPCEMCNRHTLLDEHGTPKPVHIWEGQVAATGQWYEYHDLAIRWSDDRLVRMRVSIDITARKQAEQHALELALEKERVNIVTSFIEAAAHEFRTPLAVINTSAHLMSRIADDGRATEKARQIAEQVASITLLVDTLTFMARLDGVITVERQEVAIVGVVEDAFTALSSQFEARQIAVVRQVEDVRLSINDGWMRTAIMNLLDNALRFSPDAGQVIVEGVCRDGQLVLRVRDNGPGIPSEIMARIFERFFRGDPARSERGFGLGLPMARRIVELHGGQLTAVSQPGEGSIFTITLPLT